MWLLDKKATVIANIYKSTGDARILYTCIYRIVKPKNTYVWKKQLWTYVARKQHDKLLAIKTSGNMLALVGHIYNIQYNKYNT